ncbi:hypothetical protein FRB99_007411 [Tulasnella sp. 403]|nr:hypothetical protein FRB99_007411 [Tulasnella sp. 403]
MDEGVPSLSSGSVGSRFVSEADIDAAKATREAEWKAAYARIGQEPPPRPIEDYDGRSLFERLQEQKTMKQEQWDEKMKLSNQFRGIDEEDSAFLVAMQSEKLQAEKLLKQEEAEQVAMFRAGVAKRAEASSKAPATTTSPTSTSAPPLPTSKPSASVKGPVTKASSVKKDQKTLLKGVIRKKDKDKGKGKADGKAETAAPAKAVTATVNQPTSTSNTGPVSRKRANDDVVSPPAASGEVSEKPHGSNCDAISLEECPRSSRPRRAYSGDYRATRRSRFARSRDQTLLDTVTLSITPSPSPDLAHFQMPSSPMAILQRLSGVYNFSAWPVTVLIVSAYAAILISTIWIQEVLPSPPKHLSGQLGLDLDLAWRDLQSITTYPHPYDSHQNDVVRQHVLDRVAKTAAEYGYVHVSDDNTSNATYAGGQVVYFEGNNVLVKIDGSDPDSKGGVLFSAHFDSVSTAPGATDDGMGVATLLNLVDYFAKNQPQRDVIFNINNGEEDWLNGAHAFLEHPWASIPTVFLNLEGAGNAGRPLLFRTSNTGVTKAFRASHHPHGNVLSADAFKARLVRSGTDFEVYDENGMRGLDLAFYRKRSRYHTKYDSVAVMGGKASLWAMMEAALRTGNALVSLSKQQETEGGDVVYFDIFGRAMAVLSQKAMLIIDVILLIVGPLVVAASVFYLYREKKFQWTMKGWGRFPLAMLLAVSATCGLGVVYSKLATFIVYSSGYAVFTSLLCTFYLIMHGTLVALEWYRPTGDIQQRFIVLLETYLFWWALLVVATTYLNGRHIGGLYFITFFHAGCLSALPVGFVELLSGTVVQTNHAGSNGRHEDDEELPSERTPLLSARADRDVDAVQDSHWTKPLWGLEFILSAVFPVILASQLLLVVLTALGETLGDGNPATTVYLLIAVFVTFISIPIAPYAHKVHRTITYVIILIWAITVLYNTLSFPFSPASPLKVYFQQTADLDYDELGANNTVRLVGVPGYLEKYIAEAIPSGNDARRHETLSCGAVDSPKVGLSSCTFPSLAPNVAPWLTTSNAAQPLKPARRQLLEYKTTRLTANSGMISIHGQNTRSCRIYFDDPVVSVRVKGGNDRMQDKYPMPEGGLKEVRLWSRTWDRTFEVLVEWEGKTRAEALTGRVACEWAEMREERIPALDEVVSFLPAWAVVSKLADGLFEGTKRFKM